VASWRRGSVGLATRSRGFESRPGTTA